jgi:hypothetical protein
MKIQRRDVKIVGRCPNLQCGAKIVSWLRGCKFVSEIEKEAWCAIDCPACRSGVRMDVKRILLSKKKGEISQLPI